MKFVSTRGCAPPKSFVEMATSGLAPDRGLYVPEVYPSFSKSELEQLATLDYPTLAAQVISRFAAPELSHSEVLDLCQRAYQSFGHPETVALRPLDDRLALLELFHGPTLAFKDIALQFLGHLLEHCVAADQPLTIIGATSGDTGSAAIHAIANRKNLRLMMLHPKDRVSEIQRRQMTTVMAANVRNVAIRGTFDEAQAIVKQLLGDEELSCRLRLGAVNSINWVRIAAQSAYYFYAGLRAGALEKKVSFSVPTGNFGNALSAYVASRMGLPIHRLIVATNANDICHRAISTGDLSVRKVVPTASPAMDIQVSSNFERLLFELVDRDAEALTKLMEAFEIGGRVELESLCDRFKPQFLSCSISEQEMKKMIEMTFSESDQLIDPHSAIGLAAAAAHASESDLTLAVATASPAKFSKTVSVATGRPLVLPSVISELLKMEENYDYLEASHAECRSYLLKEFA